MRWFRHALLATLLMAPLVACVKVTYELPKPCPEGQVYAFDNSDPLGDRSHCVRADADGNHFPDGVGPGFVRYVFTTEATRDTMLEHLEDVGHDMSAAHVPADDAGPWSVYCVGGTCTYEPGRGW